MANVLRADLEDAYLSASEALSIANLMGELSDAAYSVRCDKLNADYSRRLRAMRTPTGTRLAMGGF